MERAKERNELLPPRVIHRDLQCRLDRLGTAVSKVGACRGVDRADLFELLAQFGHVTVVIIGSTKVNELVHLLRYRCNDLGMAMSRRADCDPGVAVEKSVAVRV